MTSVLMRIAVLLVTFWAISMPIRAAAEETPPVLTKVSTDDEIAAFFKYYGKINIRFIYAFGFNDQKIYNDNVINQISDSADRLEKLKIGSQKFNEEGSHRTTLTRQRLNYLLEQPLKQEVIFFARPQTPVFFSDRGHLSIWSGGQPGMNGLQFNGGYAHEIWDINAWLDYTPIPDAWLQHVSDGLKALELKEGYRIFTEQVYPMHKKLEQSILNFMRTNADAVNLLMTSHNRRNGCSSIMLINDVKWHGFIKAANMLMDEIASLLQNAKQVSEKDNKKLRKYLDKHKIVIPAFTMSFNFNLNFTRPVK